MFIKEIGTWVRIKYYSEKYVMNVKRLVSERDKAGSKQHILARKS